MAYSFQSRIRYSEIDQEGRLSISSLIDYFQDCSAFQSEEAGISYRVLGSMDQAWILLSWQIVIERLPSLCERVTVTTRPYDFNGFYGMRNFTLEDEQGMAAWANSVWVLFDMKKRRPVRIHSQILDRYTLDEKLDMDYAPRKIDLSLTEWKDEAAREPVVVTAAYLDTNHHVNNGQYVRIAMDALPRGFRARQIRVEYRSQARLGDVIVPVCARAADKYLCQLCDQTGKPYALVETEGRSM